MENSANDTYLIVSRTNESNLRIVYRNELLAALHDGNGNFSDFSANDVYDAKRFRTIVDRADDAGYIIYQLTRL